MYKKIFREGYILAEKGALDSYNPVYFESSSYKQWITNFGALTCSFCASQHEYIVLMNRQILSLLFMKGVIVK